MQTARATPAAIRASATAHACARCTTCAMNQRRVVTAIVVMMMVVVAQEGLGLAARSIFVVGVLFHVESAQSLGLVYERSLLLLAQLLPLGAQTLADLRVVHLGIVLGHFAALPARPHHERVHGSLDVVGGSGRSRHRCRHRRRLHHARQ